MWRNNFTQSFNAFWLLFRKLWCCSEWSKGDFTWWRHRRKEAYILHAFLYATFFFSAQPYCCLTFSWTELEMLLRCCLIYISIIILRHMLLLCLCLSLARFMSYLCDLFFIFSLIFSALDHITSLKQVQLFCVHFLECLL